VMMSGPPELHRSSEIDERFIKEWVEYGLQEFIAYLAKQAAFADYLANRKEDPK
jgi:hypothetical protein